jgi:hypothetical protein
LPHRHVDIALFLDLQQKARNPTAHQEPGNDGEYCTKKLERVANQELDGHLANPLN